jgi:hypothetical protein
MIPAATGDDAWLIKPDRKTKEVGQPKFSPLREIAQRVPAPENALFAKNIANRVWFLLTGKGIVEPLDLHHTENPPAHPELLELLGKSLTEHHFDLRWLIREIALSKHYQRADATQRHLLADQQLRAFLTATGETERLEKNTKPDVNIDAAKYSLADFQKAFTAALANPAKEPELAANPSLRSALFLRNSDHVQWTLKQRAGNLIDRLAKQADPVEDLFLTILTRLLLKFFDRRGNVAHHFFPFEFFGNIIYIQFHFRIRIKFIGGKLDTIIAIFICLNGSQNPKGWIITGINLHF